MYAYCKNMQKMSGTAKGGVLPLAFSEKIGYNTKEV